MDLELGAIQLAVPMGKFFFSPEFLTENNSFKRPLFRGHKTALPEGHFKGQFTLHVHVVRRRCGAETKVKKQHTAHIEWGS